ncbi:proteasome component M29, partial [Tieghemiomyces parasiticus]
YARAEPFPRRVALGLVADVKPEVQEEARRCLNLGLTDKLAADDLPAFDRTVAYLTTHMLAGDPTGLVPNAMTALQSQTPTALYRPVTTLRSTAAFLRRLLLTRLALRQEPVVANADDSPEGSDPMEGESVEALLEGLADDRPVDNPTLRTLLRRQLGTVWEAIGRPRGAGSDPSTVTRDSLHLYLTLLFVLLRAVPLREESSGLSAGSLAAAVRPLLLRYLLELLVLLPASELAAALAPELPYLRTFLTDPVAETRTIAAHLTTLVLLDTAVEPAELERLVNDSLAQLAVAGSTRPAAVEAAHGHAAFLGSLVGRCTAAGLQDRPTLSRDLVVIVVTKLIDLIDATGNIPSWLFSTVFAALGDLARYQSLSRFFDTRTTVNSSGKQPADAHCTIQAAVTLEALFSRVLASTRQRLCKATNPKVIEAGLGCLGAVALGFPGLQPEVMTFFQETPQLFSKQPEVHFTSGEALVAMLIGWPSPLLDPYRDTVDLRALVPWDPAIVAATTHGALDAALNQLSDDMTPLRPPAVRKAAVLWALTLVRFGTVHPTLRAHLRSLHAAFTRLFTDKDELVQEAAAKGVGLVFEAGDAATREELVYSLLAFFREGRPAAPLRVTGDSEVFGREQLGNAPDGSTVTTYQSILSLASDMNRPELVYQLMNLANHHAVWQSRCGAAFGFAAILARSRESLQPHMVTLIPSLFRSLYDPAPPVQTAMATIWRALVPDPPATLTAHFKAIMTDLLKNLGNRQWRVREASARAVADLIGTRDFVSTPEATARLDPYLEDLWRMAFRALDDIKESVREAALPLCRTLSALTLKLVEAKPGSASVATTTTIALDSPAGPGRLESAACARAHTVLDVILPFLLDRGLTADAEPVQQFSLRTLLQLSTKTGPYLTPYLPRLTTSLLEALTEFEPATLNYLSFHTEAYEVTPDQLDHARLSASRMSPVMEAVERGLDQIRDAATMDALVPALQQLIRKGTGLATRAGVARVVVVLCMRKSHLLRDTPHPAALVKALSGNLLESSASLRKAWATAIGYLAPYVAKDITIVRLVQHLRKLYLTHPDSELRAVAPVTLREIGRHAVSRLQATADAVLPLVYVGCRDRDDGTRAVWEEVWTECNAGNSQTVQLYQAEIIALGTELMAYDSWDLKKQAALAIEAAVATLGGKLDPAHAVLLSRILEHLQGRTWAGKEAFLTCLATLVEALGATRTAETVNLDDLKDALLRECRRKDPGYRRVAIEVLGRVVTSLQVDWFADAIPVLFPEIPTATRDNDGEAPAVSPAAQPDEMDLDEPLNRPTLLMVASGRLKSLGALWTPAAAETQLRYADPVAALLVAGITDPVWKVQITALSVLGDYWQNARPVVRADPIVEAFAADEAPVVADTAKEAHQALM